MTGAMSLPRVAAIVTEYRPRSHADVIVTKLLEGYTLHGRPTTPRLTLASLYLDQHPTNDIGEGLAAKHGVPVFGAIGEAVATPDVDGVLLIGEHGDYPTNALGQILYPRRRFFDAAVAAMLGKGRLVPLFVDKHFSWSFAHAQYMVETAARLQIPLLAGSSLPLTWRLPPLVWPLGTAVEEALVVGYGPVEAYGFHALEVLQCMLERRTGGETGVRAVQCLEGDAVWQAAAQGLWSRTLLEAALATVPPLSTVRLESVSAPTAFLLTYRDGLRATVLMLNGATAEFAFAARRAHGIEASCFVLEPAEPFGHFTFLVRQIEALVLTGQPPYPAARTLLTTGVLAALLHSRQQRHAPLETPELHLAYTAVATVPDTGVGAPVPWRA